MQFRLAKHQSRKHYWEQRVALPRGNSHFHCPGLLAHCQSHICNSQRWLFQHLDHHGDWSKWVRGRGQFIIQQHRVHAHSTNRNWIWERKPLMQFHACRDIHRCHHRSQRIAISQRLSYLHRSGLYDHGQSHKRDWQRRIHGNLDCNSLWTQWLCRNCRFSHQ